MHVSRKDRPTAGKPRADNRHPRPTNEERHAAVGCQCGHEHTVVEHRAQLGVGQGQGPQPQVARRVRDRPQDELDRVDHLVHGDLPKVKVLAMLLVGRSCQAVAGLLVLIMRGDAAVVLELNAECGAECKTCLGAGEGAGDGAQQWVQACRSAMHSQGAAERI